MLGGNSLRLLKKVREYHLDTFIKEQISSGAIYLGFSAGAYYGVSDAANEYCEIYIKVIIAKHLYNAIIREGRNDDKYRVERIEDDKVFLKLEPQIR